MPAASSPLEGDCRPSRADMTEPGPFGARLLFWLKNLWNRSAQPSHPQPLFVVETLVEARDIFAVAVEQQRRPPLAGADQLFARLAPARMRHLRIDVGPETVLRRLQVFPIALRPLVGERHAHD